MDAKNLLVAFAKSIKKILIYGVNNVKGGYVSNVNAFIRIAKLTEKESFNLVALTNTS